jgi:hypothetical protein
MFRWLPLALGACRFGVCEEVPVERFAPLPDTLSATGLFDDIAAGTLAPGMPPLGTEVVDEEAVSLLTEWVTGL